MRTQFDKSFTKDAGKLQAGIKSKLAERLRMFSENPFHPLLNNHALKGKYVGLRSINITGDYRAIYQPIGNNVALFLYMDTHSNLYG